MTTKALELLNDDPDGFFLMVEGSQIDWGSHANDATETLRHILSFDETVGIVRDFARNHPDTLVVVTADHETGGLAIKGGKADGTELQFGWVSKDHTAIMVPVYSYGPGSDKFDGVFQNTQIPQIFAEFWKISPFPTVWNSRRLGKTNKIESVTVGSEK
jgi:alkaline phosphatase